MQKSVFVDVVGIQQAGAANGQGLSIATYKSFVLIRTRDLWTKIYLRVVL